MDFGKYIKQLRESRALSVRELARRSGVSFAHISQIESGQRGIPKPETIKKLADGLNWEFDDLMHNAGYHKEPISPSDKKDKPVNRAFLKLPEDTTEEEREFLQAQLDLQLEMFRKLKGKEKK
ncbi:XRE family transcriptional regulator [Brevibacillus borstelensis]|uniref:helix-turn-helix domain-containing protein n=1 Tax=Brevibacillus borstelensis TaxID=45462 RepID=UPI000F07C2F0|nr:helix-turn-helix transcriptional regulator [Brevibacillus borstelensis]MED1881242.1 helix-turn-helix transcriptional regulator [Brevibacillus borstelensis]RNB66111.1 XRE family transcriptional regulator [Brevibacillus borstelensis]GED55438.1 hypothetical protein BBO01nite_46790 [Brevibacillus borstelensis]